MKRIFLLFSFVLIAQPGFSQSVSFDNLIVVINKTPEEASEFMAKLGWQLSQASEEKPGQKALLLWAYEEKENKSAHGWLAYQYTEESSLTESDAITNSRQVSYMAFNDRDYLAYKNKVKQFKMKSLGTIIKNGSFHETYEGANYILTIITSKPENGGKQYEYTLFPKAVYYKMVAEKLAEAE